MRGKAFLICVLLLFASSVGAGAEPSTIGSAATLAGKVYLTELSSHFTSSVWQLSGLPPSKPGVADLNQDGRSDLFSYSAEGRFISAISDGHSSFQVGSFEKADPRCRSLPSWGADLNGDGRDEVVTPTTDFSGLCSTILREGSPLSEVYRFEKPNKELANLLMSAAPDPRPNSFGSLFGLRSSSSHSVFLQLESGNLFSWKLEPAEKLLRVSGVFKFGGRTRSLGGFDLDGDGLGDLVTRSEPRELTIIRCGKQDKIGDCDGWLHYPEELHGSSILLGDLNGDGRGDVFISQAGIAGVWIGLSTAVTGLELEARGITASDRELALAVIGDFNGDGTDEVLVPNPRGDGSQMYHLEIGRTLSDLQIVLDGATSTYSSKDGDFHFLNVSPGPHTLEAHPRDRASPIRINVPNSTTRVNILLDGVPNALRGTGINIGYEGLIEGPGVCTGYMPTPEGSYGKWPPAWLCPPGYAFTSVLVESEKSSLESLLFQSKRDETQVVGTCCKLPTSDMLTEERISADFQCPDDSIATGYEICKTCSKRLRCTKINSTRYQLGVPTEGVRWGVNSRLMQLAPQIQRNELPAAIRDGVGRQGRFLWTMLGCLGKPWGSVLTSAAAANCSKISFRRFEYRGLPGDPPRGTPVAMFPPCNRVEQASGSLPRCTVNDSRGGL